VIDNLVPADMDELEPRLFDDLGVERRAFHGGTKVFVLPDQRLEFTALAHCGSSFLCRWPHRPRHMSFLPISKNF